MSHSFKSKVSAFRVQAGGVGLVAYSPCTMTAYTSLIERLSRSIRLS